MSWINVGSRARVYGGSVRTSSISRVKLSPMANQRIRQIARSQAPRAVLGRKPTHSRQGLTGQWRTSPAQRRRLIRRPWRRSGSPASYPFPRTTRSRFCAARSSHRWCALRASLRALCLTQYPVAAPMRPSLAWPRGSSRRVTFPRIRPPPLSEATRAVHCSLRARRLTRRRAVLSPRSRHHRHGRTSPLH